jgi:Putative porin
MLGAQTGVNLRFADGNDHLRVAGAYYDFLNVTGRLNAPDSVLLNYTAPAFVQNGNTMFDIANSTTASGVNLFALAAHFRIADLALRYDHDISRYSLGLSAEASRNIGYDLPQIEALTGQPFSSKQDQGYVAEVSFGDPNVDRWGRWRAALGYRYVQSDAVLDAWTDADFHEGGTNALGYYFWASVGLAPSTWVRLRYMSANEINGPRYGLDIVQLDVNTRF